MTVSLEGLGLHGETKVVELDQRSDEWKAWRQGKCTASEAPIIMGVGYQGSSWEELRMEKADLGKEPSQWTKRAWEHGRKLEPLALRLLSPDTTPLCIERGPYASSLDGWKGGTGPSYQGNSGRFHGARWNETKCPVTGLRSRLYRGMVERQKTSARPLVSERDTPTLWWQLVHQAYCVDNGPASLVHVVVFVNEQHYVEDIVPAHQLLADWPRLEAQWERFRAGEPQLGFTPPGWRDAARRWLAADKAKKEAVAEEAAAKKALVKLGQGEGHGVKVTIGNRRGSVQWKNVATAAYQGDNLEAFAEDFRAPDNPQYPSVRAVKKK